MKKLRQLLSTPVLCATLFVSCALAQSNLTQILDTVINPDGSPFNGTVTITWNGYSGSGSGTVSRLSTSAEIYNGALSVLLVPTTTAAAGTYYSVLYNSSDGTVTWTEVWQVPPSTTPLPLSQVRQSSTEGGSSGGSGGTTGGGTTGGSQYATLPIAINEVTNLASSLSNIDSTLNGLQATTNSFSSTITGLTNTVSSLNSTVSNQGTTLSGLSTTVAGQSTSLTGLNTSVSGLNSSFSGLNTTVTSQGNTLSSLSSTVGTLGATVTANGTALTNLTSTVNGLNTTVTGNSGSITTLTSSLNSLTNTVNGNSTTITGLNGTVSGISSTVSSLANTISGLSSTVNTLSAASSNAVFVDAQVPTGSINGANASFSLSQTPAPTSSLMLYRNGLMQSSGVDFTLSGSVVTFLTGSVPKTGDVITAYYRVPGTGATISFTDSELPGGTVNGTNLSFTLANTPNPAASLKLYKNGVLLSQSGDYTVSGSAITFTSASAPLTGDSLLATYRH